MSCVMCHISCVTCHVSLYFYCFFFRTKVWSFFTNYSLLLMVHWISPQNLPLIYSMLDKYDMFSFKSAIWKNWNYQNMLKLSLKSFAINFPRQKIVLNLFYHWKSAIKPSFGRQWPVSTLYILAECGRHGRFNQENCHGSNGLMGKFPIWIVSRRDICEERHPGHPGGIVEAVVGVWS